jgi:hypothetical protein
VTQTTLSKHSTGNRKHWGRGIQPQRPKARVLALISVPALICVLLDIATEIRAGMIFPAIENLSKGVPYRLHSFEFSVPDMEYNVLKQPLSLKSL